MSSTEKPAIFGQRVFGETKFYFGDVDPSLILKSMLANNWAIVNPAVSGILFTNRWFDGSGKIQPLQISCMPVSEPHIGLNIGSNVKYRIDATCNCNIWATISPPRTSDDAYVLRQNMKDEVRRIIRTFGKTADKMFLLGRFDDRSELQETPPRLRSQAYCGVNFYKAE